MGFQESERAENKSLRLLFSPNPGDFQGKVSESQLMNVWYFLKYPSEITAEMDWPFSCIDEMEPFLRPHGIISAPRIPRSMVAFLVVDLRKYDDEHRLSHARFCLESDIPGFNSFWVNVLHELLCRFTACRKGSSSDENVLVLIGKNLRGMDIEPKQ
ncbi:unnamed protein product [Agarophyton chilense]